MWRPQQYAHPQVQHQQPPPPPQLQHPIPPNMQQPPNQLQPSQQMQVSITSQQQQQSQNHLQQHSQNHLQQQHSQNHLQQQQQLQPPQHHLAQMSQAVPQMLHAPPQILSTPQSQTNGPVLLQQQVPMTTIMIPSSAAAQLQSASVQIQQAAMQAMQTNSSQPQILVLMIPYMVNGPNLPPTIPPTPEQASLNSTLIRQSQHTQSFMRNSQTQLNHNRTTSSLSVAKQEPENFYVKANFSYRATRNKMELSFEKGDILHVLDTLQNSDYGAQYWLATRVKSNGKDAEKGFIPGKNKAEEIALDQRTLEFDSNGQTDGTGNVLTSSVSRVSFLKRRAAQRSKSLCKDNWDSVVFDIGSFKLPTYERVVYKHPGFCRPVVIFGPLADVARGKLLKDYPEKYSYPTGFNHTAPEHPKIIRLKGILEVIDQGKHALLDITPSAVEKLNYVSLAPIVIFMKTDSKSIIKEFRSRAAKSLDPNARDEDTLRRDGKSSRKLLEQSVKLEKNWYHVFTATLNLSTMGSEMWYRKLRETIENQQSNNVWMSEKKADKKMAAINNDLVVSVPNTQTLPSSETSCVEDSNLLSDKFNDALNLTSKSTIDLVPEGIYGNRSQLRNAYAHSLAQKLARASSEPKLNGIMSDRDEDDEDDEDEDLILKKPFPNEFENSSSVSSSNGATSYGHSSMSGSNMTYQHYPPQVSKSEQLLSRVQDNHATYSMNPITNGNGFNNSFNNGTNSSSGNYHPLPPMQHAPANPVNADNNYQNQSMNKINNNYVDLTRNHETRGSAFQVYSDLNQNSYHYYNLNKI